MVNVRLPANKLGPKEEKKAEPENEIEKMIRDALAPQMSQEMQQMMQRVKAIEEVRMQIALMSETFESLASSASAVVSATSDMIGFAPVTAQAYSQEAEARRNLIPLIEQDIMNSIIQSVYFCYCKSCYWCYTCKRQTILIF